MCGGCAGAGYAERNHLNVDGIDAAHKLTLWRPLPLARRRILAGLPFPVFAMCHLLILIMQRSFPGLLVGVAEPGRMPRMQTCLLPVGTQLAKVDGVLNAVAMVIPLSTVLTARVPVGPTSSAVRLT